MDGANDMGGPRGPGDPTSAILDRLDSIGRLLTRPAEPEGRWSDAVAHLGTRIDMLGQIVETLLADREEAETRLATMASRLIDLEASLAPTLRSCTERLDTLIPLLAEAALDHRPGPGTALRTVLREVRDAIAALERRVSPVLPDPTPHATPRREAATSTLAAADRRHQTGPDAAPEPERRDDPATPITPDDAPVATATAGPEAAAPPAALPVLVLRHDPTPAPTPPAVGGPTAEDALRDALSRVMEGTAPWPGAA